MQELCYGDFQIQAYPSNISKKRLVKSLKAILENWKKYKPIRGMIEDIFKLAKNAFSLKNLHRYTKRSVKKFVCLHVLLVGIWFRWVLTQRRNYRILPTGSWWRGCRIF